MELLEWMGTVGGVCTTRAARDFATGDELVRHRAEGRLWSPLRGWLALAGVRNDVTRALQAGGVLTCVSAFREHGLWTPHGPQHLHVRVHRETHSARVHRSERAAGITVHRLHFWMPEERPTFGIDAPETALAVATACVSEADVIGATDSAVTSGRLSLEDVRELAERLPRDRRRGLERASGETGSGSESTFALLLRRAGIRYVHQFEPRPGHFSDFRIGRSLIVEIDSQLWHATPQQQAKDRERDAALTAMGYRVLRFTYEQVLFQPDYVMSIVLALVRRRAHLRPIWG
ncbi:endonuclease domain-containing protein [Agrococcus sp. TSP3-2-1]|uniref:endonuclease domain-containing protein n=1 Tax=Agrococcus sp. TSP3-2-1 TaxID=2804583 RepID=UPI003CF0CF1F